MTKSIISLENISKAFENQTNQTVVFEDFSLSVKSNGIISIIGPSGCGKSTLMKLITGILPVDSGKVKIENIPVLEYREKSKIGYVFQKPLFFPWMTTFQNLLFPLKLAGKKITLTDIEYADLLMKKFGLMDAKNIYPNQLSGGMIQRANVIRALVMKPKLLLLDEPFNAIDEFTREVIWEEFRSVWKQEGLLVLIISHNIREAIFLGDMIYILGEKPINLFKTIKIDLPTARERNLLSSEKFFTNIKKIRNEIEF